MSTECFYVVLGVPSSADAETIRKAYKRRALESHPDKNNGQGEDMFKKVRAAYEVLSDPVKRLAYDKSRCESGFLVSGRTSGPAPARTKPEEIVVDLDVTLEDLFNETVQYTEVQRREICSSCGEGSVRAHCFLCWGDKVTLNLRRVVVPICRGHFEGTRIMLPDQGHRDPGLDPGNVVVVVRELPHSRFVRSGFDLHLKTELRVPPEWVRGGFTVGIPGIDGRTVSVPTSPLLNSQQHSVQLVLDNEGMPAASCSGRRGRLFFQIKEDAMSNCDVIYDAGGTTFMRTTP